MSVPLLLASLSLAACLVGIPDPESAPDGGDARAGDDATVESGVEPPSADADDEGDTARPSYAQLVEDDGAIAYWRLGEFSATPAIDEIDGGHNGAYVGTGSTFGQNGAIRNDKNTSVLFDGSGHVTVQGEAFFDTSAPFSMEVWIKPTQAPDTNNRWVLGVHDQQNLNAVTLKYWYMQALDVTVVRNSVATSVPVLGPVAVEAWSHLVLTFDGTRLIFYLNGVASTPVSVAGTESDAGPREIVFGGVGTNDGGFPGYVDEVALYAAPLSQAAVQAHYAYGDPSLPKDAGSPVDADAGDAGDAKSPADARPDG